MIKMICFDMDGTIADLYAVEDWCPKLRAQDPTPYAEAEPMWNMTELVEVLNRLHDECNVEIRIVTWLAIGATEVYKEETRQAKREWLERYNFPCDHFHGVQHGTTKADCVRRYLAEDETAILVDDNKKVREGWHLGDTIDPTAVDLVAVLKSLLD